MVSQGKIPWNTPPQPGIELGLGRSDSKLHTFYHWAIKTDVMATALFSTDPNSARPKLKKTTICCSKTREELKKKFEFIMGYALGFALRGKQS